MSYRIRTPRFTPSLKLIRTHTYDWRGEKHNNLLQVLHYAKQNEDGEEEEEADATRKKRKIKISYAYIDYFAKKRNLIHTY